MRLLHIWFGIAVVVIGASWIRAGRPRPKRGKLHKYFRNGDRPNGRGCIGATVTIHNPVSGFERTAVTDSSGNFSIENIPFNPYHMTVTATGFAPYVQDVEVRSVVPLNLKISLQLASATQHGNGGSRRRPDRK